MWAFDLCDITSRSSSFGVTAVALDPIGVCRCEILASELSSDAASSILG